MGHTAYRLPRSRRGFTMKELVVVVLLLSSAVAAVAPAVDAARERDRRILCASNLRQIGQAIQMYANENRGNFPRTRFDPKTANKVALFTNWKTPDSFGADGPGPNDVTSALFLLLKTQDITGEVMLCPSSPTARPIHFGAVEGEADEAADGEVDPVAALEGPRGPTTRGAGLPTTRGARPLPGWPPQPEGPPVAESAQDISNFPHRANLSYSYVNPYPSQPAMDAGFKLNYTLSSDYAIVADLNPGGDAVVKLQPRQMPSTRPSRQGPPRFTEAMRQANSPNHGGFGQNVLYADGHAEWQTTPFSGMYREQQKMRDNIYTRHVPVGARDGDPVVGPVMDQLDTVLLPTAARPAAAAPARRPAR